MNQVLLGFLRGIGMAILATILSYVANATNLQGVVTPPVAALIAAVALGLEHSIAAKTGSALFGAVKL